MPDRDDKPSATDGTTEYIISVAGVLDATWSEWFDGMTVDHGSDGTTVISGPVVDQAALHRVLKTIRDLGVSLISVQRSNL